MRDFPNAAADLNASLLKLLILLAAAVVLFLSWRTSQEYGATSQDLSAISHDLTSLAETLGTTSRELGATSVEFNAVYYPNTDKREFWKSIDYGSFFFLNGKLEGNEGAQKFWAATNNRAFDLLQGLLMGFVLWLGIFRRGTAADRLKKLESGLHLGLITIICIQLAHFLFFDFYRVSPSLILDENAIRLSKLEHINWHLKDSSFSSFPGDHATILFIGAIYIAYFAKLRFGILAMAVAIFCALPRLVAGAHWMTDVVVGGGSITIVSCSITFCLQNSRYGPQLTRPLAVKLMAIASRFLPGYDLSEES